MIKDYFISAQSPTSILYKLMLNSNGAIWSKTEAFKITWKLDHSQGVLKATLTKMHHQNNI